MLEIIFQLPVRLARRCLMGLILLLNAPLVLALESPLNSAEYRAMLSACPAKWENMQAYLQHASDHAQARITYTEDDHLQRLDLWAGNPRDRQNYIKFALLNLVDEGGQPLETFTDPVGVILSCYTARAQLLNAIHTAGHNAKVQFENSGRLDHFRDDDDTVMNSDDVCDATPIGAVVATAGQFSGTWVGCSASQRDIDFDGINDVIDQCNDTPSSIVAANLVSTADGCTDSDQDGVSNPHDAYPFQNNTECAIEGQS